MFVIIASSILAARRPKLIPARARQRRLPRFQRPEGAFRLVGMVFQRGIGSDSGQVLQRRTAMLALIIAKSGFQRGVRVEGLEFRG